MIRCIFWNYLILYVWINFYLFLYYYFLNNTDKIIIKYLIMIINFPILLILELWMYLIVITKII